MSDEPRFMSIASITERNKKRRKSQVKADLDQALLWGRCLERDLERLQEEYDELLEDWKEAQAALDFTDTYM